MPFLSAVGRLLGANNGRAAFVLRASLLAIAPSLAAFGGLVALGIDTMRAPPGALDPAVVAYGVLLAPAIETAVMLAVAAALARLAPGHDGLQIVALAVAGALAHRLGGGWRQVMHALWPMLVYATSLVLWLRRSASDAFIVTTIVHALYNAAFFAVGIAGDLAAGDG
jgi:hypothetical protein